VHNKLEGICKEAAMV